MAASLEEVIRLYGLRMWIEHSYKQVRDALDGQSIKFEATELSGGIGSWCVVPSPFVGIITAIAPLTPSGSLRLLIAKWPGSNNRLLSWTQGPGKKSAGLCSIDRCSPDRKLCERCTHGWNHGSCCSATGMLGPHSLRPFHFSSYLRPWVWGCHSSFSTLPSPCQQSTDSRRWSSIERSIAEVCEHLQREAGTNLTFEGPYGKKNL